MSEESCHMVPCCRMLVESEVHAVIQTGVLTALVDRSFKDMIEGTHRTAQQT